MGTNLHFPKSILRITLLLILLYIAFAIQKSEIYLRVYNSKSRKKKAMIFLLWNRKRGRIRRKCNSYPQNQAASLFWPPATRCEQRTITTSAANAVSLFCFWKLYSHNDPVTKDFPMQSIKRIAHNRKCCLPKNWMVARFRDFQSS